MKILRCAVLLVLTGCANFDTHQYDERLYERFNATTGKLEERERTRVSTKAGTRTIWDSDSALANFKATQTEKTQSATVGTLSQSSESTNTVESLKHIRAIMGR